MSHLPLYIASFLVAGILHELGHGLAGAAQGVPLMRFGINLSLFYPSAYTELEQAKLNRLSPFGQLRVISGGVWHNVVLAILAGVIYKSHCLSSSLLSTPLYMPPPCQAPQVKWIHPGSPLAGQISPGDIIVGLNDDRLTSIYDWKHFLSLEYQSVSPAVGYCINRKALKGMALAGLTSTTVIDSQKDCCSATDRSVMMYEERGCFADLLDRVSCFRTILIAIRTSRGVR